MKSLGFYSEHAGRLMRGNYIKAFLLALLVDLPRVGLSYFQTLYYWYDLFFLGLINAIILSVFTLLLSYGKESFYMEITRSQKPFYQCFFQAFDDGPLHVLITLLVKNLYIMLHTLLLIIPGVIRYYQLSMTSCVMIKYPQSHMKDIFARSKAYTDGHKKQLLFLDLKYLLYGFLSVFTLGILWIKFYPEYRVARILIFDDILKEKDHIA